MIGNKVKVINYMKNYKDDTKFEIKEYKEKRGLRANRYYWALINELASVLNLSKEELHKRMLADYGQSVLTAVNAKVDLDRYFKYYSEDGEVKIDGVLLKKIKVYKPSSEMDSKEFSILLNGLIEECKQQDITTLDEIEIEEMLKDYEKAFDSE